MSADVPRWMVSTYSSPRLAPYLQHCDGEAAQAVNLYNWNVMVSAAFYGPLHTLELALRNAVHDRLSAHFGQDHWWKDATLHHPMTAMVDQARRRCRERLQRPTTSDDVVTELNFGFWVGLLAQKYDRHLWVPALHRAFPHFRAKRRQLHVELETLRLLRNRIMHHEPIHHRHLAADHATLYRVISYINPDAASGIQVLDRVPEILLTKERACRGDVPPQY
ncbi:hypothetical protein [Streptomonospora litoralis]|uniref:Abi-like protein n=1 Tax=Streptomonospora litoralis TaxID=2498135 RepID=A0A4P6Q579_9ACTN|nr:hypothetical protein [Streptomonospora litoralis]QBI55763.1 Abi-like protein [Streptomonospora litoralis]